MPVVSIAAEDQTQIERLLARGQAVRLRLNVQNTFTSGPVFSENVVGDIRGSEEPDQILVVGAHLDSWDLGTGSTDDGTGVSTVLAAAAAIQKSGVRPRRTIRFVLFTGEEGGQQGSTAYTKQHADELQNDLAAMVIDSGQGPIARVDLGRTAVVPLFEPFARALRNFRKLEITDRASFGTDGGPFVLAGLPGITLQQDSPDYRYTVHSAVDTQAATREDLVDVDGATRLPRRSSCPKLRSLMKKTAPKSKNGSRIRRAAPDMRLHALAAARQLIVEQPDEALTMRAVAEAAGVTHPNLSHHFGSLAGLHAALAEELIGELLTGLRALGLDADDNDDYATLVDRVFELYDQKGLGRVLGWLVRSGETARLQPVNDLIAQFIADSAHGRSNNEARVIARDALILSFAAYAESSVGHLLGGILKISPLQRRQYFVQALTALNKMY